MPKRTPQLHAGSDGLAGHEAFEPLDPRQVDAVEDHLELAGTQFQAGAVGGCCGEMVASGFQALAPQAQTVSAPVENFDSVGRAVAKDEQVAGQGIGLEPGADQGEQSVKA
jgi:hypothetical protein